MSDGRSTPASVLVIGVGNPDRGDDGIGPLVAQRLLGLVSPEVVPFIRNEEKLAEFLDKRGAKYLIAFPDFYPLLSQRAEPLYKTDGIGPELGGENMVVYHWR